MIDDDSGKEKNIIIHFRESPVKLTVHKSVYSHLSLNTVYKHVTSVSFSQSKLRTSRLNILITLLEYLSHFKSLIIATICIAQPKHQHFPVKNCAIL